MKRTVIFPGLMILTLGLYAESVWTGNAAIGDLSGFPESAQGYRALSNSFPSGTALRVTNPRGGADVFVTVVGRLESPGVFILIERGAAVEVGLPTDHVLPVRVSPIDENSLAPEPEPAFVENPVTADGDYNPAAGLGGDTGEVLRTPAAVEPLAEVAAAEEAGESLGDVPGEFAPADEGVGADEVPAAALETPGGESGGGETVSIAVFDLEEAESMDSEPGQEPVPDPSRSTMAIALEGGVPEMPESMRNRPVPEEAEEVWEEPAEPESMIVYMLDEESEDTAPVETVPEPVAEPESAAEPESVSELVDQDQPGEPAEPVPGEFAPDFDAPESVLLVADAAETADSSEEAGAVPESAELEYPEPEDRAEPIVWYRMSAEEVLAGMPTKSAPLELAVDSSLDETESILGYNITEFGSAADEPSGEEVPEIPEIIEIPGAVTPLDDNVPVESYVLGEDPDSSDAVSEAVDASGDETGDSAAGGSLDRNESVVRFVVADAPAPAEAPVELLPSSGTVNEHEAIVAFNVTPPAPRDPAEPQPAKSEEERPQEFPDLPEDVDPDSFASDEKPEAPAVTELVQSPPAQSPGSPEDGIYFLAPAAPRPPQASLGDTSSGAAPPNLPPSKPAPQPVGDIPAARSGEHYVQAAAYSSLNVLEDTAGRLRESNPNFPLSVSEVENSGGKLYKLLVGPITPAETGIVLRTLRFWGFAGAFPYNPES